MRGASLAGGLLIVLAFGVSASPTSSGHAENPGPYPIERYNRTALLVPSGVDSTDPHALVPILRYELFLPPVDDAPLLVVLPGACLTSGASDFAGWGRHFASHGFVTIVLNYRNHCGGVVEHLSEDVRAVLADAFDPNSEFQQGLSVPPLPVRLDPALATRVDPQRVAFLGHSMGAYVGIHLVDANGEVDVAGMRLKVRALVMWDPVCCIWDDAAKAALRNRAVSVGVFTGDPNHPFMRAIESEHRPAEYFENVTNASRFGLYVNRSQHVSMYQPEGPMERVYGTSFDPLGLFGEQEATMVHPEHQRLFLRYTSAFVRYEVTCDGAMSTYLTGAHRNADTAAGRIVVFDGTSVQRCEALPPN
jgi:pimeloyl-ACP methyl ester carboxylesterase